MTQVTPMGEKTAIEWTDHTFNPWIGCEKVSPACKNCYAEALARRYGWAKWGKDEPRSATSDANWRKPLNWDRKAREAGVIERVFCASLADVFEDHPDLAKLRGRLWDLIRQTTNLRWLLLTKRPENVPRMLPEDLHHDERIWTGATVESQEEYDKRFKHIVRRPGGTRFLSCEPLLGSLDLGLMGALPQTIAGSSYRMVWEAIGWVIVGGESGSGARPMRPAWARALRDECAGVDIPFHFKQWGEWAPASGMDITNPLLAAKPGDRRRHDFGPPSNSSGIMLRVGKKAAGRELDGRTWDEFPEVNRGTP